jgi:hypothetical protein
MSLLICHSEHSHIATILVLFAEQNKTKLGRKRLNMAGNLAILRNYLDATLQVPVVTREAVILQGISSFEDFVGLTDKDVQDICSNAKKPGGTIQNPNWVAGGNIPLMIPNPGAQVGFIYEKRFRQLRFYRNYLSSVQRPMMPAQATLARLIEAWALYEMLEEDEAPDNMPEKLVKQDDARRVIENLDEYLKKRRNIHGVPLSYLVRDQVEAPDIAVDQGYATPSFDEEMIRRAPHIGAIYTSDNKILWNVIRHITHNGPGWNWVSKYTRSSDGRKAYIDFKKHYMGESFTDEIKNAADLILENTEYDGRKRTFTFEHYAERITKAFDDLIEAGEVVDDQRKVRRLLNGLDDPVLAPAKAVIRASSDYKDNYQNTISYLKAQVSANNSWQLMQRNRNVGRTDTGRDRDGGRNGGRGRGRGRLGHRPRGPGDDRTIHPDRTSASGVFLTHFYIDPTNWDTLTREEREHVYALREERDRIHQQYEDERVDGNDNEHNREGEPSGEGGAREATPPAGRGVGAIMSRRGRDDPGH